MQTPSKKHWLLGLFTGVLTLLTLANLCGLGYFYHRYTYQSVINQHQIQTNQAAIQNIEQQLQQKTPNIQKIFALYHIENLIGQAQFQINHLNNIHVARQYLKFAEQMAQEKHLQSLEEVIQNDLQTLSQIHLSQPAKLIFTLNQIQQQLENLQENKSFVQSQSSGSSPLPMWAKNLRPLIQIDRYQVPSSTIYAPTEQAKIIQEALALILPIQYAALHQQQKSYQEYLHQLSILLERLPPDEVIQKSFQTLLNQHFKIEKPIDFQSYQQVHQLIQNENLP